MSISQKQYTEIIKGYAGRRRENQLISLKRREDVYDRIPEIRRIDEKIAHISMDKARYMLYHPESDKRAELREEIHKLSMEKVNQLAIHGYPADYLDPIYTCPVCRDTGYEGNRKCSCFFRYAAEILYEQSNLTDILADRTFSRFCIDYYPDTSSDCQPFSPRENICRVLDQCRSYIDRFDDLPGQNLLIRGNVGVGKTFLSCCIANDLLARGKSVIYLTAYQFFSLLEEYTFHRKEVDNDRHSWLLSCDLLIIDDLGTEMNNAFINSKLFLYINERILKRKSTIINTNLSMKQISKVYTERVFSRIIESYQLIHIYGKDIRIKKTVSSLD